MCYNKKLCITSIIITMVDKRFRQDKNLLKY